MGVPNMHGAPREEGQRVGEMVLWFSLAVFGFIWELGAISGRPAWAGFGKSWSIRGRSYWLTWLLNGG